MQQAYLNTINTVKSRVYCAKNGPKIMPQEGVRTIHEHTKKKIPTHFRGAQYARVRAIHGILRYTSAKLTNIGLFGTLL